MSHLFLAMHGEHSRPPLCTIHKGVPSRFLVLIASFLKSLVIEYSHSSSPIGTQLISRMLLSSCDGKGEVDEVHSQAIARPPLAPELINAEHSLRPLIPLRSPDIFNNVGISP